VSKEKIEELNKRIDMLNEQLSKSNLIANNNLPIMIKSFFVFLFFLIMGFLKPDLVIKIIEMLIKAFGVEIL
jgi:hypothetical protein